MLKEEGTGSKEDEAVVVERKKYKGNKIFFLIKKEEEEGGWEEGTRLNSSKKNSIKLLKSFLMFYKLFQRIFF